MEWMKVKDLHIWIRCVEGKQECRKSENETAICPVIRRFIFVSCNSWNNILPFQWTFNLVHSAKYRISRPIRRTSFPGKCDLNSTCVLCAEGKYYFQTYKYPYIYYTTSLLWDSEICFQIMRSGITACEQLTFLSGIYPNVYISSHVFEGFMLLQ